MNKPAQTNNGIAETQARIDWQRVLVFGVDVHAIPPVTLENNKPVNRFKVMP